MDGAGNAGVGRRDESLGEWYARVLPGTALHERQVDAGASGRVHLVESGSGPPLVLVHGSGVPSGFFSPLLGALRGLHAMAVDLPGRGLSSAVHQPSHRYREAAVAWLDDALDGLGLDTTSLLGHSAGGLWALWYALVRPERVTRLVLVAPPALPGTRCPLPYRVLATPLLGELVARLVPPSRPAALRFARFMGEERTLAGHPDLVDLFVAAARDPAAQARTSTEVRYLVSPFALMARSGFRARTRIRESELTSLAVPTLVMWGDREPLGEPAVARAVADLIPHAQLVVLTGGHAPWLGQPDRMAEAVGDFVRG